MESILKKQIQTLPVATLTKLLNWLWKFMKHSRGIGLCDALRAITAIVKSNAAIIKDIPEHKLSSWMLLFLELLKAPTHLPNTSQKYEICVPNQILLYTMCCLDTFLQAFPVQLEISEKQINDIMHTVIHIIYVTKSSEFGDEYYCQLITSAINICASLSQMFPNLSEKYLGELLGASKAFMLFGLPNISQQQPTKVFVSQQAISEPQISGPNALKGGKMAKTRKVKRSGGKGNRPSIHTAEVTEVTDDVNKELIIPHVFAQDFGTSHSSFYKTSDSDFSESEASRKNQYVQKQTKLRFSALALIGVLGKVYNTNLC